MKDQNFNTTFLVSQSPKDVFDAVTNPRAWWSEEIKGATGKLNDEFDYHYKDVHICKFKLIEVVPNQKIVWLCEANHFNFIKDQSEWVGTKVIFEIVAKGDQTQLNFTHRGLVPTYECYEICENAWTGYIQDSLRDLITTSSGKPNPRE
jgi:uncharacterized protein YndB with AHSA1/START domain